MDGYQSPDIDPKLKDELVKLVSKHAKQAGMDHLPDIF